jgi:FkbM family methyltransferase
MNYQHALSRLFLRGSFPEDAFDIQRTFQGRRIVVYGAGESYHYFQEVVVRQYCYYPSVVLDRKFAPGDTFAGVPAFAPEDYHPGAEELQDGIVVVCLGNQRHYADVVQTLGQMGYCHIISLMDIYQIHNPFNLPQELEETGFDYFLNQRERIESALELFADDLSREVYLRNLQTHMERKPVAIPMSERDEQYTPKGIKLSSGYARYIYCGVSAGEMARVFRDIGPVDELVCFEPDPNQYRKTAAYLTEHGKQLARRVTAVPCAVYSLEAVEPFTYSDTSFGSRILASGADRIQTVALDHVLPGFAPTFISMDIEGAELEALRGAEQTIRSSWPDLAICVYHAPNHLWDIPLYLRDLGLGYTFYLRNYTSFVSETVLYAAV